ncbi:MAG: hypothetical protein AMS21_01920 [Gemmatimonas sp. SG8_38_2]|nr:MAG: hypothetical protein AMS21_01920 [Gemmatimonas sp. SG8_38_2]
MSYKTTATQLTADLQAWLEDDGTEFTASIPEVINLGELRLLKDLDLTIFDVGTTASTAVGNDVLTKPAAYTSDFQLGVRWMYISVNGETKWLELRSIDFVRDYLNGVDGLPKYFAEDGLSQWRLAPSADAIYTVNINFRSRPTPLEVGTTESNWLSDNAADILLYACLAEAEKFVKADDRVAIWENDYMSRFPAAKREMDALVNTRYNQLGMTPIPAPQGVR